jgi:hypothetical protein
MRQAIAYDSCVSPETHQLGKATLLDMLPTSLQCKSYIGWMIHHLVQYLVQYLVHLVLTFHGIFLADAIAPK